MEAIKVKEIMVPLEDYAIVSEEANLAEAVFALEQAQQNFNQSRYQHRAILVYDKNKKVVGKLSLHDILQGLEPKYTGAGNFNELDQFYINADYIRNLIDELGLLENPMQDICKKAAEVKVKNIMHTPTKGEYVSEDAPLNEAIIQLLIGHRQSLLVTRGKDIVGILRLTDVFKKIADVIKACNI
ncbi:MAG: CBS domain-containing protein [Desulfobacteraceae bacterium]|nr:CBS domain-containing protein [Desulfobacteraceae bacterium]